MRTQHSPTRLTGPWVTRTPLPPSQARGSDLRVHFKNSREAAASIRGKDLVKAKAYLQAVLEHKRAIPFLRYNGGVGRTSQAKNEGNSIGQARWPKKSVDFLLNLLKNAESNAEVGVGVGGGDAAGRPERASCLAARTTISMPVPRHRNPRVTSHPTLCRCPVITPSPFPSHHS